MPSATVVLWVSMSISSWDLRICEREPSGSGRLYQGPKHPARRLPRAERRRARHAAGGAIESHHRAGPAAEAERLHAAESVAKGRTAGESPGLRATTPWQPTRQHHPTEPTPTRTPATAPTGPQALAPCVPRHPHDHFHPAATHDLVIDTLLKPASGREAGLIGRNPGAISSQECGSSPRVNDGGIRRVGRRLTSDPPRRGVIRVVMFTPCCVRTARRPTGFRDWRFQEAGQRNLARRPSGTTISTSWEWSAWGTATRAVIRVEAGVIALRRIGAGSCRVPAGSDPGSKRE